MPRINKSWAEKMASKPPHRAVLEGDFAGLKKGSSLHISSPQEIASELKKIPSGHTLSVQEFRRKIAETQGCDATCPVSTAIFLRIVAEYSWEELNRDAKLVDLPPFWRVIEPGSPLVKKLSFGDTWIASQRKLESAA